MDRGTVEAHYDAKVKKLLDDDPDAAIQYMLKSMPLLREYGEETAARDAKKSHLDSFGFTVTSTSSKNDIFCRFMAEVENDYTYYYENQPKVKATSRGQNTADWICEACNVAKVYKQAEAAIVCPGCGVTASYIEMNRSNLSFDEQASMEVSSHCAYKRVNHFSEWINSLQARQSTLIPDDILDALRTEFKKARATSRSDITPARIKAHLKKLRLAKYYEHVHAISNALNGTPAPKLSPALEVTLKNMFHEIQKPFEKWVKVVAPNRKNFLSYGYVLYKFCELLGEDDLLQHFSLLKSHDLLYQMDAIWKKICQELQWEYIPTL